ncbi:MAG: ABC transporter permease, partial [Actinomycetia bacterium]|nr:ABC transporter permease [Actinomycetes bacterium]
MNTGKEVAATTAPAADERLAYRGLGQRMLVRPEIVGMLAAVLLYMFFWGATRPFGNAGGVATVLDVSATLGIMAVAVAVLMIGGEFDLSSGAMTGAMGIVIVLLVKETGELGGAGLSYWIAIPLSLAVALGIGWLNGTMVERTALPSFIVTLATFFVLRGLKLAGSKIIVDQIQVGRADEGAHYDFWKNIFGSTWERQDHVWAARDTIYTVLLLVGGVLVAMALYQFAFKRNTQRNPTGLAVLVAGLAGIGVGVILMHSLDGSDWLTMVVLAASSLVASFGLCLWRYARLAGNGGVRLTPEVTRSVGIGIGALVLAVIAALIFDSTDDTNIVSLITEQGLRAILFMTLMAVGLVYLAIGVQKARDVSPASKALLLGLLGVAVFAMALFIQSESTGPKFRAELFASMSVLALVVLCWAAMSWLFEIRGKEDDGADQLARRVTLIGGLLALAGIIVR